MDNNSIEFKLLINILINIFYNLFKKKQFYNNFMKKE